MVTAKSLADKFCAGENVYDVDAQIWQEAFAYLDKNIQHMKVNQPGLHLIWTESGGHLRNKIRDDPLILRILRATLPGHQGPGLDLYRGECKFLYDQQKIGFCWSPKIEVAEMFASGLNCFESGGVLLKAYAPPEAILAIPNNHSANQMQEFEYTCDPGLLVNVEVMRTFPK